MDDTGDPLAPKRVAAAIAPVLDRLRIAIAHGAAAAAEPLAERLGLAVPSLALLAMLRNLRPDRVAALSDVRAVFLYSPPDQITAGLEQLHGAGLVEQVGAEQLRLTALGDAALAELYGHVTTVVTGLWADHDATVAALDVLTARVAHAVLPTAGPATRVVAPAYEPEGTPLPVLVAERLTPLRFHRFDAHAAAWRAAGLSAEQVRELGPGAQRAAIEDETNRRAAAPYAVLTPVERLSLLAGLGALPN